MTIIYRLLAFASLLLVQALMLNRIQLFHCAVPLLYVYFVISFRRGYPKWGILLWSFFLGLAADMFTNTPGVAAASLTLTGLLQPYFIELLLPHDAEDNIRAAATTLGFWRFFTLALLLTLVFCLAYFALEQFTFFNWTYWLSCAGGSTIVTLMLIIAIEGLRK
ncbi:MAG: rod shape-determining protein MreD [Prevotella sp.]|nr:rod shape-determining protein MreD [Prevotella sp.]